MSRLRIKTATELDLSDAKAAAESEIDIHEDVKLEAPEEDVKPKAQPPPPAGPTLELSAISRKIKGGGFGCKACTKKFSHRYKVRSHFKLHHMPREIFSCEHCDKTFKTKYQFTVHTNLHSDNVNDYLYCCDKCDYRYKSILKNRKISIMYFKCVIATTGRGASTT